MARPTRLGQNNKGTVESKAQVHQKDLVFPLGHHAAVAAVLRPPVVPARVTSPDCCATEPPGPQDVEKGTGAGAHIQGRVAEKKQHGIPEAGLAGGV